MHGEMLPVIVCFDAKVKHEFGRLEVRVAVNIGKRELKIVRTCAYGRKNMYSDARMCTEVASPRGPKQGALEAGLWVYQFLVFRVFEAWRRS